MTAAGDATGASGVGVSKIWVAVGSIVTVCVGSTVAVGLGSGVAVSVFFAVAVAVGVFTVELRNGPPFTVTTLVWA